jgi:hypothetical protein
LVVTAGALDALADLRAAQHGRPTQALGLVPDGDGRIGLVLDEPDVGDRLFARNGIPVLFVAVSLGGRLAGRVLDYAGPPGRARFTLVHASAVGADAAQGALAGVLRPQSQTADDHSPPARAAATAAGGAGRRGDIPVGGAPRETPA